MPYSAGTAFLQVMPSFLGVEAEMRNELRKIGVALDNEVERGIADGLAKGGKVAPAEGGRAGDAFGGAMGDAIRRRMDQAGRDAGGAFNKRLQESVRGAVDALPQLPVDVDATPAQAKLAGLRERLEELSRKTVGVDLDAGEAEAQIAEIRAELLELARNKTLEIDVRADAGEAAAELASILALAREVDRSNPSIRVDSTGADRASVSMRQLAATFNLSSGQLIALIALGPAIGAAIIPGAVAAAAAVASIGSAAVASVAVAALGLSGVGAGVKALNQQQQDAAKSAASLDTSQNRVAAALDQVDSAERSLANTRRTVAEGAVRAAQQIRDAEQSVADAQRQALAAQKALNDAVEEARRQREDQAAQLKGNAIAQRQAVLDLADAKEKLDAILANPRATAAEREQAKITYDQRKLQLDNLQRDGKRLADDQAKADKAGIEGSQQVVAARERIRSTNEALGKAQQQLADAQRGQKDQQLQGAFQIAQASQAVVNAQRSVQQASIQAGTAGGAAMNNLKTAMDNLSPAGQQFARFLFSLKPVLDDLRSTAATAMLPGFERGIRALLPVVPQLKGDVALLSGELGHLGAQAGITLASPYWVNFAHTILQNAVPAMELAGHIASEFARGLAGLVRALLPLGQDVGGGLLSFAQRFATAANNLQNNQGFQHLLEFVRREGPEAAHTVSELIQALVHLAAAFGPLGSPSLTILRTLAEVINAIPTSTLQAAAQAAVLLGLAFKAWKVFDTISDSTKLAAVIGTLGGLLRSAKVEMLAAGSQGAGALGMAFAGVKGAAGEANSSIGTLAQSLGRGGVFGLAVAAAILLAAPLVSYFNAQSKAEADVKQKTDSLAGSLRGLANNYGGATKSSQDYVRNLITTDERFRDFVINANRLGVSVETISSALHGNRAALDQINSSYSHQIDTVQQFLNWKHKEGSDVHRSAQEWAAYNEIVRTHPELLNKSNDEIQVYLNSLKAQRDATDQTADSIRAQADALGILNGTTNDVALATDDTKLSVGKLSDILLLLRDNTASASDKIDALKQAEDLLNGAQKSVIESQRAFASGSLQLRDALSQANQAGVDASNITDDYTRAGHAVNDALIQQVKNAQDVYNATLAQTGKIDEAQAAYDGYLAKIQSDIDKSSLSTQEKEKLRAKLQEVNDTFGKLPTDPRNLQVTLSGADGVISQMDAMAILQRSLTFGVSLEEAKRDWQHEKRINEQGNFGHATGGRIIGPGTGTSDSIPAWGPVPGVRYWLSSGEHVLTAAEVQAAGGHEVIERLRALILAGLLKPMARYPGDGSQGLAFASGGPLYSHVGRPFHTDVSHTKVPTEAEIRAAIRYGPVYTGPLSERARAAQTWVKGQEGKPYLWAAAGPYAFDCSGIQSAVLNILTGRPIYQHTFSTMDEGNYLAKPGYGMYTAAWSNRGERGPGGGPGGVGHTAGKIGNLLFESRGGDGVVIGPRVTALSSFAHVGHLAQGGPVEPWLVKPWLMDDGGLLQTGWNPPIFNGTGAPEAVLSPGQWQNISDIAQRVDVGGGHTYHFQFRDTTLTPELLRSMQERQAVLARVGRAR